MPEALAATWKLIDDPNVDDKNKLQTIKEFDNILGLKLDEATDVCIPDQIQQLIIERNEAREKKDWKKSDNLRDKIEEEGFIVKDGPGGTEVMGK